MQNPFPVTLALLAVCLGAALVTDKAAASAEPTRQSGLFEDWKGIPSNVEFGIGDDSDMLYVTVDKSLYRIRLKTRGFHPQTGGR